MKQKRATKSKMKLQDVFLHKREGKFFIVEAKEMFPEKGWLYTLKMVAANEIKFKRCYEQEFLDKYEQVKDAQTIKLLFGAT